MPLIVEIAKLDIDAVSNVEIIWKGTKGEPLIELTVRLETESAPATRLLTVALCTSNTDEEILEIA